MVFPQNHFFRVAVASYHFWVSERFITRKNSEQALSNRTKKKLLSPSNSAKLMTFQVPVGNCSTTITVVVLPLPVHRTCREQGCTYINYSDVKAK